jgi:hypothetical protein
MNGFSELTMVCIELGVYGAIVRGSCKVSFLKRSFGGEEETHTFIQPINFFLFFFPFCVDVLLHLLIILLILFNLCLNFFNKSQLLTHFMYLATTTTTTKM